MIAKTTWDHIQPLLLKIYEYEFRTDIERKLRSEEQLNRYI